MGDFLTDVQTLRANARKEIEKGPVTASYGADVERVIEVLNQALATEIVCVLRYKQHHYNAQGLDAGPVAQEFLEHAGEEQQHADSIAARHAAANIDLRRGLLMREILSSCWSINGRPWPLHPRTPGTHIPRS